MATPIDPQSVAFLLAESRNTPIHVGGLMLFEKPADAGPGYVRQMYEAQLATTKVRPLFAKRPHRSLATGLQWVWTQDDQFDIEHHVRHSALPQPGRIRELLDLTSRLHGQQLSLERPLWETHLIEGLADGRVAMYTKMHHALVDGVSAMRLLNSAFSPDPDERDMVPPFAARPARQREDSSKSLARLATDVPVSAVRSALGVAAEASGLPGALVKTLQRGVTSESAGPASWAAPRTILNQRISGARRFAAQDWDLERMRRVGTASGTTVNDVLLAMCAGALRTYLGHMNELPEQSLIAMVPVSLHSRKHGTGGDGGNSVGTLMVKLGTDEPDPGRRLQSIHDSMIAGKEALGTMTQAQIVAMSAIGVAPLILQPALRLNGILRPPFNVIISNVPGPRQQMYYDGARLDGMYPASIPLHGQALNITTTSYDGKMGFGLTGCRRSVPHLQRLLTHLEDALVDLERAAGLR